MTSWIVKIGKDTPQHWGFARDDRFWDVREPGSFRKIEPGDNIFFWLSGSGFTSWVRATSSLYVIGAQSRPAHWIDVATGGYTHRFEFELVSEDVAHPATWGELQQAAGRNYAPPAPANPVAEPAAESFLRARFGSHADDTAFATVTVEYSPGDDMRDRAVRQIALRRGQARFRNSLLVAYGNSCAVTGSAVTSVLEAAHIDRYYGDHTNHVRNGLLLRSDIHTLFDLGALTVSESRTIQLAPWLRDTEYADLHDQPLRVPSDPIKHPDPEALTRHRQACQWL